ncbi:MAG: hypothetical protein J5528_00325, partial [Firmicutes bacterium]|nr:hypothetical protein [Bacillota bacterium]
MKKSSKQAVYEELVDTIERMGYPREFGVLIAESLKGEKSMARMSSYLHQFRPSSAEEIADEMLSIMEEYGRWRDKKISEYYNQKMNRLMNEGLTDEEDDDRRI